MNTPVMCGSFVCANYFASSRPLSSKQSVTKPSLSLKHLGPGRAVSQNRMEAHVSKVRFSLHIFRFSALRKGPGTRFSLCNESLSMESLCERRQCLPQVIKEIIRL